MVKILTFLLFFLKKTQQKTFLSENSVTIEQTKFLKI
jgi:hypothetical protein